MKHDCGEHGPLHCVPLDDTHPHTLDDEGSCWCEPVYDEDYSIYVHNSADGREDYEEGRRKPH